MAKKGLNIYKRKDGRWEGRYKVFDERDNSYKYKSIYGKSFTDIKEKLILNKSEINKLTIKSKMTVKNLFSIWLDSINGKVKTSTFANYKFKLEKHIYCLTIKFYI